MDLETFYNANVGLTYEFPVSFKQNIPYLPLNITGPWKQILEEVKQLEYLFVNHRDDGYSSGWSSICLHGLGVHCTDADSMYPEHAGKIHDWTEIAEQCPVATDYFKNTFPYRQYWRLRFMRLAPGGYITPHNDGNTFTLSAVNISLNNPENCNMVVGGVGVVPFEDSGTVMAFNTSYNHCVWNRSDEARYHMIVHGVPNSLWHRIMQESYRQYVAQNVQ